MVKSEFQAFALISFGYFVVRYLFGVPFELSLWITLLMTIGMYHGSYDVRLIQMISTNSYELWKNLLIYSVLGAILFWVWVLFPQAFMLFFLLETIVHFGTEDAIGKGVRSIAEMALKGLLPIVSSTFFYPNEVLPFFSILLGSNDLSKNWISILGFFAIFLPTLVPFIFFDCKWKIALKEILTITAVFVLIPPPFSFGLYFVIFHSLRHLKEVQILSKRPLVAIFFDPYAWLVTFIVAIPLAATAFFGFLEKSAIATYPFIVFACLTFPHAFFQRRLKKCLFLEK